MGFIRNTIQNQCPLSLYRILCEAAVFQITDPRDKIYAILGLVQLESIDERSGNFMSATYDIKPDYRKSPRDVFIEATKAVILRDETLDICGLAGLAHMSVAETLVKNLPSWVPDFGVYTEAFVPMSTPGLCTDFDAAGDSLPSCAWPLDGRPDVMELSAHLVDSVTLVAQQTNESHPTACLAEWTKVASSVGSRYIAGMSTVSAFWRTCTALRTSVSFTSRELFMGFYTILNQCTSDGRLHSEEVAALLDNPLARQIRLAFQLNRPLPPRPLFEAIADDAINAFLATVSGQRRFFVTRQGYIGLGPAETQCGDQVHILRGARLPFLLRETRSPIHPQVDGAAYRMVGEAYVHGITRGEAVPGAKTGWEKIFIY